MIDRKINYDFLSFQIKEWIKKYAKDNKINCLVVGVSGGIDSAVVSTLCAETGLKVYALGMPIHQNKNQENLSDLHLEWLIKNYSNVESVKINLTETFDSFKSVIPDSFKNNNLSLANTRSRLRMVTLYQIAGNCGGIVVGTGNKVEDYGIGFYTKYGDGGVDIAPIADLYKSEVYNLGKHLGIINDIINAKPTDGLWDDNRTDEDQIGTTYDLLEWAMEYKDEVNNSDKNKIFAIEILKKFNTNNKHKMIPIPTFKLEIQGE